MHRFRIALASLALTLGAHPCAGQSAGPLHGWLLLEGGGRLRGTEIVTRFVALAGGPDKHYVAITTAISDSESRPSRLARCEALGAGAFGVAHITCLSPQDRAAAGSAAFLTALRAADGVWFFGGEEDRLVDRYAGTPMVAALQAVLDRGITKTYSARSCAPTRSCAALVSTRAPRSSCTAAASR